MVTLLLFFSLVPVFPRELHLVPCSSLYTIMTYRLQFHQNYASLLTIACSIARLLTIATYYPFKLLIVFSSKLGVKDGQ